ncbi:5'-methylthioadenosine/S-adenosylhomocysteine nucleosidase [Trueperella sp. LYQ141]|uniref:5'-methylthioadenosine/S-adenosylhomocysteine nucleosidase n=1 Tax=Trueperella sp. LYQ141 TaxID=3391058 RepID=UPI003983B622
MSRVNAIVITAMAEEMQPFDDLLTDYEHISISSPFGTAVIRRNTHTSLLFLVSGVGMTAAASMLSWALTKYDPRAVISVGSAGSLSRDIRIGQIVAGTQYVHGTADASAFGYALGQIPGQPARQSAHPMLVDAAQTLENTSDHCVHLGLMMSSDSFVTEKNMPHIRATFPDALSADMESHALAQTAAAFGIPFISLRAISDVIGRDSADEQAQTFKTELPPVSLTAAQAALQLLHLASVLDIERSGYGPTPHFSQTTLQYALYLAIAKVNQLDITDVHIPENLMPELADHLHALPVAQQEKWCALIAAGQEYARNNPRLSLTAKEYDLCRSDLVRQFPQTDTTFLWPPTSQTVIKRFNGYWNDALVSIGLTPRRGRARGGLKFSVEDYLFALRRFLIECERNHRQPSFAGYSLWLKEDAKNEGLPSGAAIRQRFGSWKEALNAARTTPPR